MNDPLEILLHVGPKGGNLNNPVQQPEARRAHLNAPVMANGGLGLHRFEQPDAATAGRKKEQAWHRMAAYMLNAGRTNSEIALAAGVNVSTVSDLRNNKWFQELCATIANAEGEEIVGLLKAETAASIEKVVALRDFSESETVQLAASRLLIEQSQGKPLQKIVSATSRTTYASPEEEYSALQQELATLRSATTKKA